MLGCGTFLKKPPVDLSALAQDLHGFKLKVTQPTQAY